MIIVEEIKQQINAMLHPEKSITNSMSIVEGLTYYYKLSIIPFVIYLLLDIGLNGFSNLTLIIDVALFWIFIPIGTLISAGILHFFGKSVFRKYNGDLKGTFTAETYAVAVVILFAWTGFIPVVGGYIPDIFEIWAFFVLVLGQCNLQKINGLPSALVVIGTGIVLGILTVVLTVAGLHVFGVL